MASISSIRFRNVKGLRSFSIALAPMNILVGPNNAGKSTIIGALRVLDAGLRRARAYSPERFGPAVDSRSGWYVPGDAIPISMENIHTDYEDVDSSVTFRLENKNELELVFPRDGGCIMLPGPESKQVSRPTEFRAAYPVNLGVVPVLGHVEHEEEWVQEDTVRRGLYTHRASRHFRSYWMYRLGKQTGWTDPTGLAAFERFAALVRETWPGMDIDQPYRPSLETSNLVMFARENRIPRELYWSGSGFQVWCQILSHLLRTEGADLVVIDEPELYLHPNLQRQLMQLLRDLSAEVVLATHSTDIINEAEPGEILLIDKKKRSARRVTQPDGVRIALDNIGASRSVVVTQLARTRRALLIEGDDFHILKRWAAILGLRDVATSFTVTPVPLGGFPTAERIRSICDGLRNGLGDDVSVALFLDRDYRPDDEVQQLKQQFRRYADLVDILRRKEVENYLLEIGPLGRALVKRIGQRKRGVGVQRVATELPPALDEIYRSMRSEAHTQTIARAIQYRRLTGVNETTATRDATQTFDAAWGSPDGPRSLVHGKDALAKLNAWAQQTLGVSVTPSQIAAEFIVDDIAVPIRNFLRKLDQLRRG